MGGSSPLNSVDVISPARNASQRLLMRSCEWVRDLRVASLHPAESVFLLVVKSDLILFLSFLISLILSCFVTSRSESHCSGTYLDIYYTTVSIGMSIRNLKNQINTAEWLSPGNAKGEADKKITVVGPSPQARLDQSCNQGCCYSSGHREIRPP